MRSSVPSFGLGAFALALSVLPLDQAEAQVGGWLTDPQTGCRAWSVAPQPNRTITWSGPCANGVAQGVGALQLFQNGKPTDRHEGEFQDGMLVGRGVYTHPGGTRYEGEFREGKPDGRGVAITPTGDRYEGEFRNGKQEGRGVYVWHNGDRYEGEFRDGKPTGRGTKTVMLQMKEIDVPAEVKERIARTSPKDLSDQQEACLRSGLIMLLHQPQNRTDLSNINGLQNRLDMEMYLQAWMQNDYKAITWQCEQNPFKRF